MNWFVRTAEGEFGPISFDTVAAWARDARLLASDEVRGDADGFDWQPAGSIPELGLVWRIYFHDGTISQPIHAETLVSSLQAGDFQPDWKVEDVRHGTEYELVDVACALLMEQNRELKSLLEDAHTRLSVQGAAPAAPEEPASPGEWQRLVRDLDFLRKEESKLRKFLEDELARSRQREEQIQHSFEQFKANERAYEERINLLSQSRERMNNELHELREAIRAGSPDSEIISLKELALGNQELGRELARLQERLREHNLELQAARAERDQAEALVRETAKRAEDQVAKERAESQKSRDQLVRLEHKHREMLAAYRELSDRLILMRNESLRGPRPDAEPEYPPPAPRASPRAGEGPRVNLY